MPCGSSPPFGIWELCLHWPLQAAHMLGMHQCPGKTECYYITPGHMLQKSQCIRLLGFASRCCCFIVQHPGGSPRAQCTPQHIYHYDLACHTGGCIAGPAQHWWCSQCTAAAAAGDRRAARPDGTPTSSEYPCQLPRRKCRFWQPKTPGTQKYPTCIRHQTHIVM
jgi:hypothetical protein